MTIDISELRRLAEAAMPGPDLYLKWDGSIQGTEDISAQYVAFIAAANPQTVIEMLDDNARLRSQRDAAYGDLSKASALLDKTEQQLAAANAEIERLRQDGPTWLRHAVAVLHDCVDQTDPRCPVGTALTRAGLERRPSDAGLLQGDLHEQLAAMTTARDEALSRAERAEARLAETEVLRAMAEISPEVWEHGYWHACSGCHELNESHPTGPYIDAFDCHLGSGCHECGGIGAVWAQVDAEQGKVGQ